MQDVRKINPTTAEVLFDNGNICTIDFYSEDIFRIFQDNAGGIVRDPQAMPPARILVEDPRTEPGTVDAFMSDGAALVKTSEVEIRIWDGGIMSVTDLRSGKKVIEGTSPTEFDTGKVTMHLKKH